MPRTDGAAAAAGEPVPSQRPRRATAAGDLLSARNVLLSITALFALGVAQPLLDLLGHNVEFFAAHDASPLQIGLFAVGTTILLPLLLGAAVLLVGAVHRASGVAVHGALTAALTAIVVLAAFRVTDADGAVPGWLTFLIAGAVGVAVSALYRRSGKVRLVLCLAAIAAPVAAATFLFATPANRLLFPAQDTTRPVAVSDGAPPIVMVVFDEFPAASILDARGRVDATAFPSFARLAEDGTFFNNATTVHARTVDAIPAIVSGRRTPRDALPTVADHPTSILNLLSEDYQLRVFEPVTALCPREKCRKDDASENGLRRAAGLVRDLAVIEAHLILPADWAGGLPPLDGRWKDFAGTDNTPRTRKGFFVHGGRLRDKWVGIFRDFIGGISPSEKPTLHFLHVAFPHYPWLYFPDGTQYQAAPTGKSGLEGVPGIEDSVWDESRWPVLQGYQRHLLQVQLADRLTGELLDRLEAEGLYDDTLIVVVADHGASFQPGGHLRSLSKDNLGEIAGVPLFIKAPGQTAGETSDKPVETVDILPSMLDLLGVTPPDNLDGVSVFGDALEARTKKRVSELQRGVEIEFDARPRPTRAAVDRKLSAFGVDGHLDPFALAPDGTQDLLGQQPAADVGEAAGGSVQIDNAAAYGRVDLDAPILPAVVSGRYADGTGGDPPTLAVAVNGTIEAVTIADPAGPDGANAFRVLLPPGALRQGANDIAAYVVEPGGELRLVAGR